MVGNSSVCCTVHTVIATPVLGRSTRLQPTWSIASIASRIVTNCLLVAAAFRSSTMRSPSATASQYCYGTRHRDHTYTQHRRSVLSRTRLRSNTPCRRADETDRFNGCGLGSRGGVEVAGLGSVGAGGDHATCDNSGRESVSAPRVCQQHAVCATYRGWWRMAGGCSSQCGPPACEKRAAAATPAFRAAQESSERRVLWCGLCSCRRRTQAVVPAQTHTHTQGYADHPKCKAPTPRRLAPHAELPAAVLVAFQLPKPVWLVHPYERLHAWRCRRSACRCAWGRATSRRPGSRITMGAPIRAAASSQMAEQRVAAGKSDAAVLTCAGL